MKKNVTAANVRTFHDSLRASGVWAGRTPQFQTQQSLTVVSFVAVIYISIKRLRSSYQMEPSIFSCVDATILNTKFNSLRHQANTISACGGLSKPELSSPPNYWPPKTSKLWKWISLPTRGGRLQITKWNVCALILDVENTYYTSSMFEMIVQF